MAVDAPPAPPNRRARNAARTRAAITAAARELFDARGYDQTTIEQIAEAADVAPRTVFRYFPTKESILFARLEDVRRQIFEDFDAFDPTEQPLRALVEVLADAADLVQDQLDDIAWGYQVAQEHAAGRAHAEVSLRNETVGPLAARIAARLGVDPDRDPRPEAWAATAMALFGSSVRAAAADTSGRTRIRTVFRRLVKESAGALTPG